ncbi:MAG: GH3 auxin-responsive promoter family protein [Opitutaceae bacterium]
MVLISRSLLNIGAGLLSVRASMRLRGSADPGRAQRSVFKKLIPKLAHGSVWREAGIEAGMGYEAFRERVPLHTYEDLAPHVEQMKRGEADVLWPGRCHLFSVSSGTTVGRTKYIPVTEAMLAHFRRAGLDSILWYTSRMPRSRIFTGRHLFLGGSTTLAQIPESEPFEAYAGDLSGIAALNLPHWVEKHLYEPGTEIAQMADWPGKIAAITERTLTVDITALSGIPSWILILADSLIKRGSYGGVRVPDLQALWPNFECYVHGGVPIGPFQDELRSVLGPTVNFHEVYPASEAFIAAQDAEAAAGLRLMADAGVFFEFLPMGSYNEARVGALGTKAVPISGVETGLDYALVITTPAGFARYVIGDVVRFNSTKPARLTYVGRTKLQLSAFGEHVIEKEITDALMLVCRRNGWTISNFHVAPMFAKSSTGRIKGRHEWWVELKPGTLTTPTGPLMAVELDMELRRLNEDYDAKREGGGLDPPFVRLVMPGLFEHWMRYHGKWGGQNKMPRCRSDRLIADELGSALQFAKD